MKKHKHKPIIGNNTVIKENVFLGRNVEIGDNCYLDYGVIIRDNVKIGNNAFIGARCILGEFNRAFMMDRQAYENPCLVVGDNALIRSETILYAGSRFGDYFQTGHRVTVREKTIIGNNVKIGTLSDIQGDCEIGNFVNMHSNVHIGQKSIIHDFVWIFPYVVLTNDPTPPSEHLMGVTLEKFVVVATMSVILPGVLVKEAALIGAGSIVTKNVSDGMVMLGNPAKEVCHVTKIKNKLTGEPAYPWQYTFERGMPWEGIGYESWIKNSRG